MALHAVGLVMSLQEFGCVPVHVCVPVPEVVKVQFGQYVLPQYVVSQLAHEVKYSVPEQVPAPASTGVHPGQLDVPQFP
jgi:hypothetical protein